MADRIDHLFVGHAGDGGRPIGGPDQTEQHPQRRGLAGAVGPEKPRDPAGLDVEAEIVDGDDVPEAFGQTVYLNGSHGCTVRPGRGEGIAGEAVRVLGRTADLDRLDLPLVGEDVADAVGYRRVMRGREP